MQWQLPVPDLTTLSHSSPGEHCIQPVLHAVWNGTSNTSWYQRQASQEAGLALSRQGLGRQHTYLCTNTVCKAVAGPPQLAFFQVSSSRRCLSQSSHSQPTVNAQLSLCTRTLMLNRETQNQYIQIHTQYLQYLPIHTPWAPYNSTDGYIPIHTQYM